MPRHEPIRKRVTVTLSDWGAVKARNEAALSGMTTAQWIAWLVESYEPPTEVGPDDE